MSPLLSPLLSSGASMIMDVLILVLLFVTIIFAARLSFMLKAFRDSRQELNKVIRTLNKRIDKAEGAVTGMREAARESGRDLQELINESKVIADELQLVNEAGGNMASRLEKLAKKNSSRVIQNNNDIVNFPEKRDEGFSIRDFDTERDTDTDTENMSRAERELYDAMQGSREKWKV